MSWVPPGTVLFSMAASTGGRFTSRTLITKVPVLVRGTMPSSVTLTVSV